MTKWQRRTRLVIAVAGIAFAVLVASRMRSRTPGLVSAPMPRSDPKATVESAKGRFAQMNGDHEDIGIQYEHYLGYDDGSSKLLGATITTERAGGRTFTTTADEARVDKDRANFVFAGHVVIKASDGMIVRTENATYTGADGLVQAPGLVEFSNGRLSGTAAGVTYAKDADLLTLLDQVRMRMAPDQQGGDRVEIESGTAQLDRANHIVHFDRAMKATRDAETVAADAAVAHLSADEQRLEALDLRGHASVTATRATPGTLKALTGRDIDLKYGADGRAIQAAAIRGSGVIELSPERGQSGRQITANVLDLAFAPDGSMLTRIAARESVQLTMGADKASAVRTIGADTMDGTGTDRQGLTGAQFAGHVEFRERGRDLARTVHASALDVTTTGGLSTIEEARFSKGVRFEEGTTMSATAAAARYLLNAGKLELRGTEPASPSPRMWNERIDIEGKTIDVTLDGPIVAASGDVRSTLHPVKKSSGAKTDPKVPSMLKQDQEVSVTAGDLTYDGTASKATYTGAVQLWQGPTKIKAGTITIDDKSGDLSAGNGVTTTSQLLQEGKDKKKERVLSTGSAKDFHYVESERRATYTGDARLVDPQGDVTATKIDLYLKASGDEVDRAEAHEKVTLVQNGATTTGDELKYFSAEERYEMRGKPVRHQDACKQESTAGTLTLFKGTNKIVAEGGSQNLTQTKSGGSSCP